MKSAESLPLVSILLPVRNEADFIRRSLGAVLSQDYPADCMEVLVADGMSMDGTRALVLELGNHHPDVKLDIIDNPGRIVATGLNKAIGRARGDIILRVDGHCIISTDYVRNCVNHIEGANVDGVGGPMKSIGKTPIARAIAIGMSSTFGVGNSAFRTTSGKTMLVDTVPFPAYTRQIVERAGPYDEELVRNQDDEYNYRIRELGGRILLADDVRSTYFSRTSLKSLWRQYFQYGFWKVRVLQKHPLQMSLRQFVPPAFVLALLVNLALTFAAPWGKWAFIILLGSYLLANITASVLVARKHGWHYLPLIPLVFSILHISYGLGFLLGLARFAGRWQDRLGKTPVFSP